MTLVSGFIELELGSKRLAESIAEAIRVEALNPPDPSRGVVEVIVEDKTVRILVRARDFSAARTLFNTYLSLAASAIDAITSLEETGTG